MSSSPPSDWLRPPHPGKALSSVSVQRCQQMANKLRHTVRRAVQLYQQVGAAPGGPEQRLQMSSVLQEAFCSVQTDLQAVRSGGASCGPLADRRTLALLEKYSDMLLQITQSKLDGL
uniref:mitogen-activated protein kinase-binding protein 1-like n=1 Tax=Centroberyx gerrardi TaxID=166262 RepID=UPI003AAE17C7